MSYEIDQECTTVKQTIERQFPDLDADEIEARRQIDDLVERGFLLSDEGGYSFRVATLSGAGTG